ncbi:RNA helicase [Ranunculus cassubicifolius]
MVLQSLPTMLLLVQGVISIAFIYTIYLFFYFLRNSIYLLRNSIYLLSNSIALNRFVMILVFYRDYFPNPKILPDTHVESIRLRSIFRDIIQVLQDKRKESGVFHGKDLKHLDGLDWEVLVMDETYPDIRVYAHGKIVIHLKFLELCPTDVELATIIAQSVGYLVVTPQHVRSLLLEGICKTVYKIPVPDCFKKAKDGMLFSQRQYVFESDHIGMMLMATAGYDPRAALALHEGTGQLTNDVDDFLRLVPTGNKRAQYLRQFMEEAITIYQSSNKFSDAPNL